MKHSQLLLCSFGITAILFVHTAQARSARRLEGEGIRGGIDALEGQFPYQISVQTSGQNRCGGSILSERLIITAAHCVINKNGSFTDYPLKVVGGISDLNQRDNENRVAVDVTEVFVPKEYIPKNTRRQLMTADIAILRLNEDLDIDGNPNLDKIKLPEREETYAGKRAIISGFGVNDFDIVRNPGTGIVEEKNRKSYGKMRYAKADVLRHEKCRMYYANVNVTGKHLCAAVVQRQKDKPEGVCAGDSGSPLVYEGIQIGVLSASPFGCREDYRPAVYTRVSEYVDFINKVVVGQIDDSIRSTTLRVGD